MSSYPLYMPDELKDNLAKIAKEQHRSLNSQILHLLSCWLNDKPVDPETQSAITDSNPGAHIVKPINSVTSEPQSTITDTIRGRARHEQTVEERAEALKSQGDWPDKSS